MEKAISAAPESWLTRNHFLLRRLHSLSGIVPIGVFLINHLLTNAMAFLGPERFNEHVQMIQDLPFLIAIEVLFIFLPLAFHAAYGIKIALEGRPNANQYPYMDNWRYTLQRVTAWITVVFVIVHLLHFRFAHWLSGLHFAEAAADPGYFKFTQNGFFHLLPTWLWVTLYLVGLTAAVFHFCNGIVTFCITWGITVGDRSRKRILAAASGLAAILMVWGVLSLYAFVTKVAPAETTPAPTHRALPGGE